MTLYGKARIGLLASLNGLLDRVFDKNSTESVRQFIRDVEHGQSELNNSLAEARANETSSTRERDRLQGEMSRLDEQINAILSDGDPSNDHLANALQAKFNGDEQLLAVHEDNLKTAQTTLQALNEVASALEAKHTALMQQLSKLTVLDSSTKAKEIAADAIESAGALTGVGDGASVDNMVTRMEHRGDVADAKLSLAMNHFGSSTERDEQLAGVAASLADRKRKIEAAKGGATA